MSSDSSQLYNPSSRPRLGSSSLIAPYPYTTPPLPVSAPPNVRWEIHDLKTSLTQITSDLEGSCDICMEAYDEPRQDVHANSAEIYLNSDHSRFVLSCGHSFGGYCLDMWMESNCGNAKLCPLCRREIIEWDDENYFTGESHLQPSSESAPQELSDEEYPPSENPTDPIYSLTMSVISHEESSPSQYFNASVYSPSTSPPMTTISHDEYEVSSIGSPLIEAADSTHNGDRNRLSYRPLQASPPHHPVEVLADPHRARDNARWPGIPWGDVAGLPATAFLVFALHPKLSGPPDSRGNFQPQDAPSRSAGQPEPWAGQHLWYSSPMPKLDDRFARQNRYEPPPEFPQLTLCNISSASMLKNKDYMGRRGNRYSQYQVNPMYRHPGYMGIQWSPDLMSSSLWACAFFSPTGTPEWIQAVRILALAVLSIPTELQAFEFGHCLSRHRDCLGIPFGLQYLQAKLDTIDGALHTPAEKDQIISSPYKAPDTVAVPEELKQTKSNNSRKNKASDLFKPREKAAPVFVPSGVNVSGARVDASSTVIQELPGTVNHEDSKVIAPPLEKAASEEEAAAPTQQPDISYVPSRADGGSCARKIHSEVLPHATHDTNDRDAEPVPESDKWSVAEVLEEEVSCESTREETEINLTPKKSTNNTQYLNPPSKAYDVHRFPGPLVDDDTQSHTSTHSTQLPSAPSDHDIYANQIAFGYEDPSYYKKAIDCFEQLEDGSSDEPTDDPFTGGPSFGSAADAAGGDKSGNENTSNGLLAQNNAPVNDNLNEEWAFELHRTMIGTQSLYDFFAALNLARVDNTKSTIAAAFLALHTKERTVMQLAPLQGSQNDITAILNSKPIPHILKVGIISLQDFMEQFQLDLDGTATDEAVCKAYRDMSKKEAALNTNVGRMARLGRRLGKA
ncbi:hypothetical protein BCR34DRAFT_597689 [Clohesyomyces aquaticus]|uniref:RING-type domain-containing protein n=1 Tax=Clohesyomyces aquaticus TaxID=1231657 RepID=A0A1Y2A1J4_9PLEO|nr:hypothetical protein BCR34DRAFT_597689 [Clohesyomyces aquaticus]